MEIRSKSLLSRLRRRLVNWKNNNPIGMLLWLESLRLRAAWNLTRYSDLEAIIKLYRDYSGRVPDLDNPVRFSEKMQWLKLNNRDPLQTILADKHAVRAHLTEMGYGDLLCRQLACSDDAQTIDFDALPDRFVAKAAHGSGWNLICSDKTQLDRKHARRLMAAWLRQSIFWNGREWPYRDMPRRVVIEEYLSDESGGLRDYKFYCFNGEPRFVQANSGRSSQAHAQNFYSLDWQILPFGKDLAPRPDVFIPRPSALERMVDIARDLSAAHPFIRVDLYDLNGRIVFGELTFYPASGLPDFTPDKQDFMCGEMLVLPEGLRTV